MEIFAWLIVIVVAIGVIVVSVPVIGGAIYFWWLAIPLILLFSVGWFGFFFGVGLDIIIFVIKELITCRPNKISS